MRDSVLLHQLTKVLRLRKDAQIVLFDGITLLDHYFCITDIAPRQIHLTYVKSEQKTAIKRAITLYQAIPNHIDKVESIIKNTSQVGVRRVIFFATHHSQKTCKMTKNKLHRLEKIAAESVELSGGNILPEIQRKPDADIALPHHAYVCTHAGQSLSSIISSS